MKCVHVHSTHNSRNIKILSYCCADELRETLCVLLKMALENDEGNERKEVVQEAVGEHLKVVRIVQVVASTRFNSR